MAAKNHRISFLFNNVCELRSNVKCTYTELTKGKNNPTGIIFDEKKYKDGFHITTLINLLENKCPSFLRKGYQHIISPGTLKKFFNEIPIIEGAEQVIPFDSRTIEILNHFVNSVALPQTSEEIQTIPKVSDEKNNDEILSFGQRLRFLYNTDEIPIGVEEANSGYDRFKFSLCPYSSIIRDVLRFNMRVDDWGRVREMAKELIGEKCTDEVLILCYLSLFECELREALSELQHNRVESIRRIRKAKNTYFDKTPISQHNNKDYWFWLGRWYFDIWYANRGVEAGDLRLSLTNFNKSLRSEYTWFVHCYKCIVLKLLDREDFKVEREIYKDKIIKEKINQPKKQSVRIFRIASFLLNDDMPGLKSFLPEDNLPSSASDFQSAITHFAELIFFNENKKQTEYKAVLQKWVNNLPVK